MLYDDVLIEYSAPFVQNVAALRNVDEGNAARRRGKIHQDTE